MNENLSYNSFIFSLFCNQLFAVLDRWWIENTQKWESPAFTKNLISSLVSQNCLKARFCNFFWKIHSFVLTENKITNFLLSFRESQKLTCFSSLTWYRSRSIILQNSLNGYTSRNIWHLSSMFRVHGDTQE